MMLPSSPGEAEKDAPVPMLHMWVDPGMSLHAVRDSMHSFVATPPGQHWQLSRIQVASAACTAAPVFRSSQKHPLMTLVA